MRKSQCIKKISDILPGVVKVAKRKVRNSERLRTRWNELVDNDILCHTEAREINGNTLTITVDSATWLHYISTFKKEEILRRFQEEEGKKYISDIKFYVGNLEKKQEGRIKKNE